MISQYPEAFQKVILEEGGAQTAPRPPPGTIQISAEEDAAIKRVYYLFYHLVNEFRFH